MSPPDLQPAHPPAPDDGVREDPARCANCGAVLAGAYCHGCGQSARNPMKHLGHAIEDVFESFWHLDGRVFGTLRDLLVPGRLPSNFLAGRRARYVAPMRLFVILTLFAFFVAKLMVVADGSPLDVRVEQTPAPAQADAAPAPAGQADAALPGDARATGAPAQAPADAAAKPRQRVRGLDGPVAVAWLPGFANRWLDHRRARLRDNLQVIVDDPRTTVPRFVQAFLGGMPTALFLLMPVFALLLKLAWTGSGLAYLEHLVVALYSHCWLMLVLLASFALLGLDGAPGIVGAVGVLLLWLWTPVYLFMTQAITYGGGVAINLLRYVVVGSAYSAMVLAATLAAALAGLTS